VPRRLILGRASSLKRLFCGAVRIETTGAPLEMGHCQSIDCRHYAGAPIVA